jgi:acetyl-CoA synthetase
MDKRDEFWRAEAALLDWETPFTAVVREDFSAGLASWFEGGTLRPIANALTRHLAARGAEPALIELGAGGTRRLSFTELSALVAKTAAALVAAGLGAGDRVGLFLPPRLEGVALMLACARQGMTYVPLSTALPAERVVDRLRDCGAKLLLVAAGDPAPGYNEQRDRLIAALSGKARVVVAGGASAAAGAGTGAAAKAAAAGAIPAGAQGWDAFLAAGGAVPAEAAVSAAHPLFLIYADSFAGSARGGIYRAGGFLVHAASAFDLIFQVAGPARVLSTRSLASVAGQSMGFWGPLLHGHGIVLPPLAEGLDAATLRRALAEAAPRVLLSAPSALEGLLPDLDAQPLPAEQRFERVACCGGSLPPRLAAVLAEKLDAEAAQILNLWVQQESGVPLIASLPHQELRRPGALGLPLPGVDLRVLDEKGVQCESNASGQMVLAASTPGMVAEIWGQPGRLREVYFERLPGHFHTGDTARVDKEGFVWFMGRLDEVVKIEGQSLSTAEMEALLASHPRVAEAAVVGVQDVAGDSLTAFVVPESGAEPGSAAAKALEAELSGYLKDRVGDFARPRHVFVTRELPRTRSGKIVRRLLKRIAAGDVGRDEDLGHLANPEAVLNLIESREKEG